MRVEPIDRHLVFAAEPFASLLPIQAGDQVSLCSIDFDCGQLPGFAFAQTQARAVLQQDRVVLSRLGHVVALRVGNGRMS